MRSADGVLHSGLIICEPAKATNATDADGDAHRPFDFDLPAERIALRPIVPRDAARLLVVRPGGAPA